MDGYGPVLLIVIQLIFLEGILSIDNAAVLGAMVSTLPDDQTIPWPKWLRKIGRRLNPLLGKQRLAALRVGLLGAYVGRGAMLFITSFLIQNPWIRLVGAAYLIRLAFNELGDVTPGKQTEAEKSHELAAHSFWNVVLTVEFMDLIFSIDNVVAAVSLSNKLWVVMIGVAIGILTMRFAAGIFSYAVQREPILQQAAYILVLNIGVELVLQQVWHIEIADLTRFAISASTIILSLAYAHSPFLQKFRFILNWLAHGIGIINELVDWILAPLRGLFRILIGLFKTPSESEAV